ncbi:hypothetical protein BJ170DRAFT_408066 [Xylariales sp. AK1849]|nr:hypothetical protein BJ170DRAFT_408066 [Xylariales sp. AK1849]
MQDPDQQKYIISPHLRPAHPGLEATQPPEEDYQASLDVYSHPALRHAESQQQSRSAISQPDSSIPQSAASIGSDPREGPLPIYTSTNTPISSSGVHTGYASVRIEPFKIDEPPRHDTPQSRRISGLSVLVFWALMLVLVIITSVGLAIGLAIGLRQRPTSTTTTPSSTNVQGVSSPAPTNPYCPSQDRTTITPNDASGTSIRLDNEVAQTFEIQCDTHYPSGAGFGNPGVRDIMLMTAPDLLTCMALCAQYNTGYSNAVGDDVGVGGGLCVGVSLIKAPAEFCYLKNATGVNDTSANVGAGVGVDSAVLLGDLGAMSEAELWEVFGGGPRAFGGNGSSEAA